MTLQTPTYFEAEINRLQLEILALRKEKGSELITIAEYILARLEQLGVRVSVGNVLDFYSDMNLGVVHVWSSRRLLPPFLSMSILVSHISRLISMHSRILSKTIRRSAGWENGMNHSQCFPSRNDI